MMKAYLMITCMEVAMVALFFLLARASAQEGSLLGALFNGGACIYFAYSAIRRPRPRPK